MAQASSSAAPARAACINIIEAAMDYWTAAQLMSMRAEMTISEDPSAIDLYLKLRPWAPYNEDEVEGIIRGCSGYQQISDEVKTQREISRRTFEENPSDRPFHMMLSQRTANLLAAMIYFEVEELELYQGAATSREGQVRFAASTAAMSASEMRKRSAAESLQMMWPAIMEEERRKDEEERKNRELIMEEEREKEKLIIEEEKKKKKNELLVKLNVDPGKLQQLVQKLESAPTAAATTRKMEGLTTSDDVEAKDIALEGPAPKKRKLVLKNTKKD